MEIQTSGEGQQSVDHQIARATSPLARTLAIARAHLAGEWFGDKGARAPVAPLVFQGFVAAVMCGIARDGLTPFAYGVVALSIPLALTTLSLLGELGPLLRADPAAEWIGAQPVRPVELRAARVLVIVALLGVLALGSLIPAAVLAPAGTGALGTTWLVVGGLLQTLLVAAVLLWIQALFGERAETALVLVQTAAFVLVLVGFVAGLKLLPALAELTQPTPGLLFYPPSWFAAPLGDGLAGVPGILLATAVLATVATFLIAPFPPAPRARRTTTALARLLTPLRVLAAHTWVRREERGPFELIFDALPTERDFVIRTYPLVAVPLAFLLLGADPTTVQGEGLFALLLFAPATYLPILLAHVPATATPGARWIVDTAPITPAVEDAGARKAIAVRLLVPLYIGLTLIVWIGADLDLALRLAPPAAVAGLVIMRFAWRSFVRARPLSTSASELGSAWEHDWTGRLLGVAIGMTLLAILVWRTVDTPAVGIAILGAWVAFELVSAHLPSRTETSISSDNQTPHTN
ncbi:MAG: hypothetical protein GY711_35655 [bacterium]|nr:hypothetical protein [bacterium]